MPVWNDAYDRRAFVGVGLGYARANSTFGRTAPLLYQASLRSDRIETFDERVTVDF